MEVTVAKDRYNNATKTDTITTDTNWTISLTPLGYDHNQLGILREGSSNQGNSNAQPPQSSYARVSQNLPGKLGQQSSICWNSLGLFRDYFFVFQDRSCNFQHLFVK